MLHSLTVSNIVLIERLTLSFKGGLTVLTGETGAGKSILLDALGLALGSRADFRLIREGADAAHVSAVFRLDASHPVWARLAEADIPPDEELILRRRLKADGKSSASINDVPVSAALPVRSAIRLSRSRASSKGAAFSIHRHISRCSTVPPVMKMFWKS